MRWNIRMALLSVSVYALSSLNSLSAQKIQESALRQIQSLIAEKESRTPAQQKLNSQLWYAIKLEKGQPITEDVPTLQVNVNKNATGKVMVEITARVTNQVLTAIKTAGGEITFQSALFNSITALVPILQLEQLASNPDVKFITPYIPPQHGSILLSTTNKTSG